MTPEEREHHAFTRLVAAWDLASPAGRKAFVEKHIYEIRARLAENVAEEKAEERGQ